LALQYTLGISTLVMACFAFFTVRIRRAIVDATASETGLKGRHELLMQLEPLKDSQLSSWLSSDVSELFTWSLLHGACTVPEEDQELIADAIAWCVHVKRYQKEHPCSLRATCTQGIHDGDPESFVPRARDNDFEQEQVQVPLVGVFGRAPKERVQLPLAGVFGRPALESEFCDSPCSAKTDDDGWMDGMAEIQQWQPTQMDYLCHSPCSTNATEDACAVFYSPSSKNIVDEIGAHDSQSAGRSSSSKAD